jgi:hypothetical protein
MRRAGERHIVQSTESTKRQAARLLPEVRRDGVLPGGIQASPLLYDLASRAHVTVAGGVHILGRVCKATLVGHHPLFDVFRSAGDGVPTPFLGSLAAHCGKRIEIANTP